MSTELSVCSLGIALNACLVTAMSMVALPLVSLLHFKLVNCVTASTKLCHTPVPCNINVGCAEHSTKPMVEHNIKTGS